MLWSAWQNETNHSSILKLMKQNVEQHVAQSLEPQGKQDLLFGCGPTLAGAFLWNTHTICTTFIFLLPRCEIWWCGFMLLLTVKTPWQEQEATREEELSTLGVCGTDGDGLSCVAMETDRHSQLLCSRGGSSQMGCAWWLTSSSSHCERKAREREGGGMKRDIAWQGATANYRVLLKPAHIFWS